MDLATGRQRKWIGKFYEPSFASVPRSSPDGKKLVYGQDGNFYVYDIAADKAVNITEKLPTGFIDTEDDHNVMKPLTSVIGWSSDSKYLLIRDLWDIWQLSADGREPAVNLTRDGRTSRMRYQRRFVLDPEEKGIDLSQPVYVAVYGEWTKKSGIARINPGKKGMGLQAGAEMLVWDDIAIGTLIKAKHARYMPMPPKTLTSRRSFRSAARS